MSSDMVNMTPSLARRYLTQMPSWQRTLNPPRVKYLSELIQNNKFEPAATDIRVAITKKGEKYLINGQHTLNAIIETNARTPVLVNTVTVKDEEHARRIYWNLDDSHASRRLKDIYKSEFYPKIFDVEEAIIPKINRSVVMVKNSIFNGPTLVQQERDRDEMLARTAEWMPEAKIFLEAIKVRDPYIGIRELHSAGFMAVSFVLLEIEQSVKNEVIGEDWKSFDWKNFNSSDFISRSANKDRINTAVEFIRGVAKGIYDETRFPDGDPRKVLHNYLKSEGSRTPTNIVIGYSRAWNRYYKGLSMFDNQIKNIVRPAKTTFSGVDKTWTTPKKRKKRVG